MLRFAAFFIACAAFAQDSESSLSMPVTLSGGAFYSDRLQLRNPDASPGAAAFRAMLYPTLKLGSHWFAYAAVQVRSMPYFYYDAFLPDRGVDADVIQAFVGYSAHRGKFSMVLKAGRLVSAFGSFPLRYDDAENPLLDQPLAYITEVPLRADQIPCGTADLRSQFYGSVGNACGGTPGRGPGLQPVTLYGLPGFEADISDGRVDARLQLTSGSPANPQGFGAIPDSLQWTAGAGYSIRQGFRVGVSGFRGPYLEPSLAPLLPAGSSLRDFPASGIGVDAQWARGHWNTTGEWQRFHFDSPNFVLAPSIDAGYVEVKRILTPRYYVAGRLGYLDTGSVLDRSGVAAGSFGALMHSYELGGGAWLNRSMLIKASYSWLRPEGSSGSRLDIFGVQFVATIKSLGWAFQ